jgi:hypothetical protein
LDVEEACSRDAYGASRFVVEIDGHQRPLRVAEGNPVSQKGVRDVRLRHAARKSSRGQADIVGIVDRHQDGVDGIENLL